MFAVVEEGGERGGKGNFGVAGGGWMGFWWVGSVNGVPVFGAHFVRLRCTRLGSGYCLLSGDTPFFSCSVELAC